MANLSTFFGFLAALLAMVGLYGVVSFMVVRRRNEIGVRMALGATRRDIHILVLREAGTLVAIGLGIGIVLAIGAAYLGRSLLFGLTPSDPVTLVMASRRPRRRRARGEPAARPPRGDARPGDRTAGRVESLP